MVIALIIVLPLVLLGVGFLSIYGVYLGLKWNVQVNIEKRLPDPPKLPSLNPFERVKQVEQQAAEMLGADVYSEWVNGPVKGGDNHGSSDG